MEQSSECQAQRIYIGNLPEDVKVSHLLSILPDGYDKSKLEIRHNYDIDKNITSSYAFVNITGAPSDIKSWCLNASKKSLGGYVLQVQFAKLSFLERLKQEVDSNKRNKDFSNCSNDYFTKDCKFPQRNLNAVRFESKNNYADTCEIESNSEKRKIKDESDPNLLSNKSSNNSSKAEIIRVESIKHRSSAHDNQQKMIQMSIKKMANGPSNKIIFQNSDDELGGGHEETAPNDDPSDNMNKRKLFDESESENDEYIAFENVKRKSKLIRTNISAVDERFRMDSRFFDNDQPCEFNEAGDLENEQGDLLKIADSLIQQDPNAKIKVKKKMNVESVIPTRFNPLEKKHSAFVIKKDEDIIQNEVKNKPKLKPFKVEKERYYNVNENLKEQFKCNESSGFSLLGLFGNDTGSQNSEQLSNDKTSKKKEEKPKKINVLRNPLEIAASNFFNVDENSDIEEEKNSKEKSSRKSKKSKLTWNEPLFIPLNDPRIEEALKFFSTPMEEVLPHAVISRDLKNIVKKKYQRNIAKKKLFKTKLGGRRKIGSAKERKHKRRAKDKANF